MPLPQLLLMPPITCSAVPFQLFKEAYLSPRTDSNGHEHHAGRLILPSSLPGLLRACCTKLAACVIALHESKISHPRNAAPRLPTYPGAPQKHPYLLIPAFHSPNSSRTPFWAFRSFSYLPLHHKLMILRRRGF